MLVQLPKNTKHFSTTVEFTLNNKNLSICLATLKNKREDNEDNAIVFSTNNDTVLWAAVADGLGGHRDGEEASFLVLETLAKLIQENPPSGTLLFETELSFILENVAKSLNKLSKPRRMSDYRGDPDTTLALVAIYPDRIFKVIVGDSSIMSVTDTVRKTIPQGEGSYVAHTMGSFHSRSIGFYTCDLTPTYSILLHTDGCDEATKMYDDFVDATKLVTESVLHDTDNATAITITTK